MAVQEQIVKENIHHIINQLQIINFAATSERPDLVLGSIAFIEIMLQQIKQAL